MAETTVLKSKYKTNILYIDITREDLSSDALARLLEDKGVRTHPTGPKQLRAVTHYHITGKDIETALDAFKAILK